MNSHAARISRATMRYGVAYQEQSEEAEAEHHRQRAEKNLKRRAKELGYEVRKVVSSESPPASSQTVGDT